MRMLSVNPTRLRLYGMFLFIQQVLTEINAAIEERKKHGRRMVIEEVDDMSDEEQQVRNILSTSPMSAVL